MEFKFYMSILLLCSLPLAAMQQNDLGRVEDFAGQYMPDQKYDFSNVWAVVGHAEAYKVRELLGYSRGDSSIDIKSCVFDATSRYLCVDAMLHASMVMSYQNYGVEGGDTIYKDMTCSINYLIDTEAQKFIYENLPDGSKLQEQKWTNKWGCFTTNNILFSADRTMAIDHTSTGFCCFGADCVDIYAGGDESELKKVHTLAKFPHSGAITTLALSDDNKKIALAHNKGVYIYTLTKYLEKKQLQQK